MCFFPLGLTITLLFLVFDFSFLALEPKMLYVIIVEFPLSVEGSLFFKLKKKLNVDEDQEDSKIF